LSASGFLLDVNIWLAWAFPAHAHHRQALEAYKRATPEQPACFCRATQQGFLRVASGPAFQRSCNIIGLTNRDALAALDQIMASPAVAYREEPAGLVPLWHRLAALPSASPKVWMDAYLAAFAVAGGLQMVTLDRAFSQFAGVSVTILAPDAPAASS
jgi:toxin-antitoxin system PIN domain toxin